MYMFNVFWKRFFHELRIDNANSHLYIDIQWLKNISKLETIMFVWFCWFARLIVSFSLAKFCIYGVNLLHTLNSTRWIHCLAHSRRESHGETNNNNNRKKAPANNKFQCQWNEFTLRRKKRRFLWCYRSEYNYNQLLLVASSLFSHTGIFEKL